MRWKDNLLVPMLSHSTVLEWEKAANYLFFVLFGFWIFIHKEKLTSGIPEPQAYGANTLTRETARKAKHRAHIMYRK